MAVVFISPQKRQKTFLIILIILAVLFSMLFAAAVFLSKPPKISPLVSDKGTFVFDTKVFDSHQFKNLEPFVETGKQFAYSATDRNRRVFTGFLFALSADDVRSSLTSQGLTVTSVVETTTAGRANPFAPY